MMQVSGVNASGSPVQAVKEQPDIMADSASKDIQNRILDAQKQRQELSSNMEMTAEEKADKRQKIQQEISDLKRELRQKQAEEKKRQQEEKRAAEIKEEQKKNAFRETIKNQQKPDSAQEADVRQQDNMAGSVGRKSADSQDAKDEAGEALSGVVHKSMSREAAFEQVRIVRNSAAQREGTARIREAEINQDAARGADVGELKKEYWKDIQKEARRTEQIQAFMFEGQNKAAEPAVGTVKQISGGVRGGLYDNDGAMFKTYFQSVQMDIRQ